MELIAAGAVLAVMMATGLQLLGLLASGRKALRQRQTAVREAGNLMQRASALPWDKLNLQTLDQLSLSENAHDELPHARLDVSVEETPSTTADQPSAEPKGKRISISIRWMDNKGRPAAPVKLVAWRYR